MTDEEIHNLLYRWGYDLHVDLEYMIRETAFYAADQPHVDKEGVSFFWREPLTNRDLADPTSTVKYKTIKIKVPRGVFGRTRVLLCEEIIRRQINA